MLKGVGSDPSDFDGEYISIRFYENPKSRKTHIWQVTAKKDNSLLGALKWFSRWRKYAFFPEPDCVFEEVCLGDIAEFLKWATHTHRHGL